jgi:type VI secretion system protein ImpJ
MSLERNVVWSEGMFIAPQHFQQFDRAMRAYAEGLARLDAWGDDYGFAQLELNAEHFGIGKLSVRRAIGVLPDRTYFELDAEQSMDIPDGTVEKTVYLAVPLARLGTTQVGQRRGVHRMLSERVDLHDLSDHMNEPIDAEVASLGVCLRIEGDDLSGFAVIPVARILEKTAEGALVLDRGFVPPALAIAASDTLMDRLSDIISLARARAANTGGRIEAVRNSQSIGSFISERLELEALNRGLFALQNAVAQPQTSARRVYGMLGELTVALEAADAQVTDPLLVYDPREVGPSFEALFTRLRRKLTLQSEKSVVSLPWNTELFEKRRLLRMVIQPRMLQEGRRPVLSVSSPLGNAPLREIVPSVCKLAGITAIPELVQMGLPGIRLTPLGTAPSELRDKDGSAFFAVDTGSPHWQKFLEKKEALAMHVDDRIPSLTSTLYLLG